VHGGVGLGLRLADHHRPEVSLEFSVEPHPREKYRLRSVLGHVGPLIPLSARSGAIRSECGEICTQLPGIRGMIRAKALAWSA
jgi:hypothetical protein